MKAAHHLLLAGVLAAGMTVALQPAASAAAGAPLRVAEVSASTDDGNVAANTLDNDLSTRWSAEGNGVWIRYDLGSAQTIGSVTLAWHKGDTRVHTFDVELSQDGSAWTKVLAGKTSSGRTIQPENYDFPDGSARYLRVVGHGNTGNDWTSITETTVNGADGGSGTCRYPAEVLDLRNWYVGLPVGEPEKPKNVHQPELATYAIDPWFTTADDCAAVRFRAAVNGVTTSGSNYPRSELREMTNSGTTKAAWSSTEGTHTMVIDQAITALPNDKPEVVAGQIHGGSDDISVFRLEGGTLYVTDGDTTKHKIADNYVLGTKFQAKFVVSGGEIKAYYNGAHKVTIRKSFDGGYFKAGAYTQANCSRSDPCGDSNYGEVKIYGLTVTHDGGGQDPDPGPGTGRVVNVANSSQLRSAFSDAQAGDRIVLADGQYSIGKLTGKNGTAAKPITVVAANRGKAVVTEGQLEVANSSHVTIDGLKWTNSNTLKITSSNNVRLTRNHFRLTESSSLKWVIIQGANSHHNRIDHNLFEEKRQLGNFITIDGSETQQSQHDRIDHNHFRDIGPRADNEMEAIRVGWSGISKSSGYTVVESNLFENCDGDPEIVSVKSNDNIVRYNTFRTSQGVLSYRHGNRGAFYGNFFLGGGKAGTGGIRLYGQDHKVYNNYFEGLTGRGYDAALQIDGGDVDTSGALSSHWRVYRATVVHNTFVNNVSNIEVGANYKLAPVDSTIAGNVVTGGQGKLINEVKAPVNMTYTGNIAWPTGSATVGVSKPEGAVRVADPLLARDGAVHRIGAGSPAVDAGPGGHAFVTDDMDGQPRTGAVDAGADELSSASVARSPLTAADVGPQGA